MQKRKSRQRVFSVAVAFLMLVTSAAAVLNRRRSRCLVTDLNGFDRGAAHLHRHDGRATRRRPTAAGYPVSPQPGLLPGTRHRRDRSARSRPTATIFAACMTQPLPQSAAARKIYDYSVAFNGFAAVLTGAQAAQLASQPRCLGDLRKGEAAGRHPHHARLSRSLRSRWRLVPGVRR